MAKTAILPPPLDDLGQVAQRALLVAGYTQLEQFTELRAKDVAKIHGIGPKTIRALRAKLAEKGLSFADEA